MTTCRIVPKSKDDGSISAFELKCGQVAEITAWDNVPACIGLIVKRRRDGGLETLAGEETWEKNLGGLLPVVPNTGGPSISPYRVRILPNGTRLVIEDNE